MSTGGFFVANMNRGTGTARAPIRVVSDVGGQPSVAVADYQSEADADALARDLEETKRLLYVAITRARDRLYLSGVVTRDGFRPTRGSLGEVLPQPVRNLFVVASALCWMLWLESDARSHGWLALSAGSYLLSLL